MSNKKFYFLFSVLFTLFIVLFFNNTVYGANEVDVALFWGQSNMVGSSGKYTANKETSKDTRNLTGIIDDDIIENYEAMNYVKVNVPSGTAYEYNYLTNSLTEINSNTKYCGEKLTYKNGKLYKFDSSFGYYSLQQSYGTNMIPMFCSEYYKKTGRTLVVVMAANGGEAISHFLPSNDSKYGDTNKQYIYEAMSTKYKAAISCIKSKGYTIKNQFYVVFQGESDCRPYLASSYYDTFLRVHNTLKKNLGLKFGAIVETGRKINALNNTSITSASKVVHQAQEKLAKNNKDIIIATNFAYNAYINKEAACFCLTEPIDNSIHLTSAALSQIGKNSAASVAAYTKVAYSNQAPHIYIRPTTNQKGVTYTLSDGNFLNTFLVKKTNSSGNALLDKKFTNKLSRTTNKFSYDLPSAGKKNIYFAKATDSYGNTICNTFTITKTASNTYKTNNAPNLSNIYSEKVNGKIVVYFTFSDGNGIKDASIKNFNQSNYVEKKLQTLKSSTAAKRARIAVSLDEMTYKDGKYYIFVKAHDTSADNLCLVERVTITVK